MILELVYHTVQFFGILAFAVSGALVGVRNNLDMLGVIVVGAATGIGGGILKDLLLGINPPTSLVFWPNVVVAVAGTLLVFFFHHHITRRRYLEIVADAFGLGLFSANTAAWAITQGYSLLTAVFVGTITAIGGGVVRDVLVNIIPGVLTRELYAVSALCGAFTASMLAILTGTILISSVVGGSVAITLRLLSHARGWHLPHARQKFV
ncbi:TRIC cation channel family protein [Canibacter sp. lx-72]|uniref:trimeric intracellular cation channel family protein n=1 Tax=Canibacter zhuwentaonis TaxID=2837491 RepID=UPI001BDC64BE|nr:TRIC cation channel family protein [Canibacter zhuwentaonis]